MQLYLDSYGAYLGVKDGQFWVRTKNRAALLFPVREVQTILLARGVSVSTTALHLAITANIPVILLDRLDHPIGQVWSGQFGSISTIRKQQALWSMDVEGMRWVRRILFQKVQQQLRHLMDWHEREAVPKPEAPLFQESLAGILRLLDRLEQWSWKGEEQSAIAATFRGWEGSAGRFYFAGLALLIPPEFGFRGRSKRPAYDPFNALLNYLYGFLYALVELAQMKAGLDPYTGVLHADQHQRPTLVFDMIELYRGWAEQVALSLCRSERLQPGDFFQKSPEQGIWLAASGKPTVIKTMLAFLDEKMEDNGQIRRRRTQIDIDAQRLARQLKDFRPVHTFTSNP